uniref:ZP domain-containing protein n=1 Tax=Haplochromis burtoni TaxID=8153 RepID=A0A3Q2VHC9_HAPBU
CRHWISRVFFVVLHNLYFEGRGIASYQGGGEGGIYISRLFTCWKVFPGQTFSPQCFQLGENLSQESSCRPKEAVSEAEMVISAGLRECETESSVKISSQKVSREPLSLTWHFSLHILADVCTSQCSSTVYQQGEAVLLEARVEALMHPPVYVDSCVATLKPDPLSLQGYSCHLMATLKQSLKKTCFFHRPTFSLEGDSDLCECCSNLSAGDTRLSWRQVGHPFTNTIYTIIEVIFTSCSKCNIVSVLLVCSGIC